MGIPACGKPIVKVARIRNMVTNPHYRRMRWNPLRLHLQFILGNERRYFYDFFMICCGPMPLQGCLEDAHDALIQAFTPDGYYLWAP